MEPIYMKAVFNVIYCIKNGVGLFTIYINPIPAGVLENQDMRPPPLNPMFYVQIWQMMHH